MEHSITGEKSWSMDSFELPDHDVQKVRRNFPGCEENKYYSLAEIQKGDYGSEGRDGAGGMTETDADTSGKMDGPYTAINKKKGKYEVVRNKLSATSDMYNTDKAKPIGNPLKGGKKRG